MLFVIKINVLGVFENIGQIFIRIETVFHCCCITLKVTALAVAPRGVLENRKFFLHTSEDFAIWSALLLEASSRPSCR